MPPPPGFGSTGVKMMVAVIPTPPFPFASRLFRFPPECSLGDRLEVWARDSACLSCETGGLGSIGLAAWGERADGRASPDGSTYCRNFEGTCMTCENRGRGRRRLLGGLGWAIGGWRLEVGGWLVLEVIMDGGTTTAAAVGPSSV